MSAGRPGAHWAAPVVLFLFALCVRALPYGRVFDETRTVFAGNDAWYHMRRVRESLATGSWPTLIDFDPLLNWPHGARPIWTPLFDTLVAAVALPFHALGGLAAAEVAAAWLPPLLGALCVVALYRIAREILDESGARIAAAILAVLVGHTWYSQIGFVDHHVAVSLAAALLLLAALRFVRSPDFSSSLLVSAAEAGAVLLWPGALLHVALVELALAVGLTLGTGPRSTERLASAYKQRAVGHFFALGALAPFCLGQQWPQWSDYSATVLSLFQPLLFGTLGLHAAACALVLRGAFATNAARRAALIFGTGGAIAVLCFALLPGLREAASEAWGWFGRGEDFQASVAESAPLLSRAGRISFGPASLRLSWLFLLLPFIWGAYMRSAWRDLHGPQGERRGGAFVFGVWAFGILVAAFAQTRFAHSASLAVALLGAWSLRALLPVLAARLGRTAAIGALAVLTLLSLEASLRLHAKTLGASLRGELTTSNHSKRRLLDTADWLRENASAPMTGVLAPWHLGHPLLYVSGLPMVVGNFGDDVGAENFELHREYFRSTEARAVRLLDRLRTRFVVVESIPAQTREQLGPRMILRHLSLPVLRDLEHHRLRYASPSDGRPPAAASYRVFERVAGARIEGRAAPGSTVRATLRIGRADAPIGSALATVRADSEGRYSLALAQAGSDGDRGVWSLESDGEVRSVAVPETAILGGSTIRGPSFGAN